MISVGRYLLETELETLIHHDKFVEVVRARD